jgi:hypothetical protein
MKISIYPLSYSASENKGLKHQGNRRMAERQRRKRRVTSLDPGTDSTVRAAWFPT